jgi:hypothetical protein
VIITPLLDKKRTTGLLHLETAAAAAVARDGFVIYLFIYKFTTARRKGARRAAAHTNVWGVIFFN